MFKTKDKDVMVLIQETDKTDRFANFVIKLRTTESFGKLSACKKKLTLFF